MLGTQSQRTKSDLFVFFSCFYDKLCMDSIVAEITGSIHHITSSITHNTHTESHLGVFGCEMGVLLLHFQTFSTQETNSIPCLPLGRDLVSSLLTHWGLPRPQQYVLHLTLLVTGQGLRIIFAELKQRSHCWVDVSIINQRRISPKQCLPC